VARRERDVERRRSHSFPRAFCLCPLSSVRFPSPRAMDWKQPAFDEGAPARTLKRRTHEDGAGNEWKRPQLTDMDSMSQPPPPPLPRKACSGKSPSFSQDVGTSSGAGCTSRRDGEEHQAWKLPSCDGVLPPPDACAENTHAPRHEVSICRVMLQLILPAETAIDTKYRREAAHPDRINTALSKRYCHSKACAICNQKLPQDDIHELVQLWVKLGDDAQTNYLASMYEAHMMDMGDDEADAQHRTDYYMENQKVCKTGLCAVLGTTEKALMKRIHRTLDMRKTMPGDAGGRPERQTATPLVDLFSWSSTMALQRICRKTFTQRMWMLTSRRTMTSALSPVPSPWRMCSAGHQRPPSPRERRTSSAQTHRHP